MANLCTKWGTIALAAEQTLQFGPLKNVFFTYKC